MSAFKKLKSTDAFVSTYVAKKSWNISGSIFNAYNIQTLAAESSSGAVYLDGTTYGPTESGINNQGEYYKEIVYKSIYQLYYSNYNNSNGTILDPALLNEATSSNSITTTDYSTSKFFHNYEQSSFTTGSRYLGDDAHVYSLPRDIIGTHIEPNSFKITANQAGTTYFGARLPIIDNGEGDLVLSASNYTTNVGNIFYSHGIAVLTNTEVVSHFNSKKADSIEFKSNQPIFTYNYHCKISDYEFNHTQNKTALTGSNNILKDNVSGSNFNPYITSVGLYNDAQELIAVCKLGQPLTKPSNTELAIQVKLDI